MGSGSSSSSTVAPPNNIDTYPREDIHPNLRRSSANSSNKCPNDHVNQRSYELDASQRRDDGKRLDHKIKPRIHEAIFSESTFFSYQQVVSSQEDSNTGNLFDLDSPVQKRIVAPTPRSHILNSCDAKDLKEPINAHNLQSRLEEVLKKEIQRATSSSEEEELRRTIKAKVLERLARRTSSPSINL